MADDIEYILIGMGVDQMGSGFAGQRRIRVGAAVATALLGFVTGCGTEDTDPNTNTQPTNEDQQQNEQQQPGSKQPDEPAEPEEYTFVKQYIDAINEVKKGGDSSTLLDMSTDDCETCSYMAQYHEDVYKNGGKYTGEPVIEVLELVDGPTGSDPTILRVKTEEPKVSIIEQAYGPEVPVAAGQLLNDFELTKEGGQWKVSAFCEVTESQPSGCATQ